MEFAPKLGEFIARLVRKGSLRVEQAPGNNSLEAEGGRQAAREMRWKCYALSSSPQKTILVVMVIVSTATLVYVITLSFWWSLTSIAILLLGVHDFVLPVHFRMTEEGVERRVLFFTRRKAWDVLRSYYPDKNGVFLSPFRRQSRLENYRGIYIRYAGNREQVLEYVKERMRDDVQ